MVGFSVRQFGEWFFMYLDVLGGLNSTLQKEVAAVCVIICFLF